MKVFIDVYDKEKCIGKIEVDSEFKQNSLLKLEYGSLNDEEFVILHIRDMNYGMVIPENVANQLRAAMEIQEEFTPKELEKIKFIERALGYEFERPKGRSTGYTTAYIARLLLSRGSPIELYNFDMMRTLSDMGTNRYYIDYFKDRIKNIYEALSKTPLSESLKKVYLYEDDDKVVDHAPKQLWTDELVHFHLFEEEKK